MNCEMRNARLRNFAIRNSNSAFLKGFSDAKIKAFAVDAPCIIDPQIDVVLFRQPEPQTNTAARFQRVGSQIPPTPCHFTSAEEQRRAESFRQFETVFRLRRNHHAIDVLSDLISAKILALSQKA